MKEFSKSETSPGLQCETENSVRIFEIRVCVALGHLFDDQPSKRSSIYLAIEETQAWIKKAQAWVIGPLQPMAPFKASTGKEVTEREEVPVNREGSILQRQLCSGN